MRSLKVGDIEKSQREELFNMHAMYVDPDVTEKQWNMKLVPIRIIDLALIPDSDLYQMNTEQAAPYLDFLRDPASKYPAISENYLIDGCHRITVAKMFGEQTLEVLDFTDLINPHESGFQFEVSVLPDRKKKLVP